MFPTGDAEAMFPQVPDPTAPYAPLSTPYVLATGLSLPAFDAPAAPATPSRAPVATTGNGTRGPDAALAELIAGNARFVAGTPRFGHSVAAAVAAAGRLPSAAVVACMDARVPVEAVFDQDVGALCAVRSAAHVLDRSTLASVEFAVGTLGVSVVMVLGHSRCAAITAAVTAARTGTVPHGNRAYVVEEIWPAVPDAALARDDVEDLVTRRHTERVADRLRALIGETTARVVAGHYDVTTGRVGLLS
jgi:carbonic anhydrase